ncbi:MAG TPA: hypothetical protein VF773_06975 [Verrucomicrobiae bacterium]
MLSRGGELAYCPGVFSCGAILSVLLAVGSANDSLRVLREMDLEAAPHFYYSRETKDRFGRLQKEIEAGRVELDRSGEKAFLGSLLKALEIPASSQMLVFSTTSLQLSLITPSNPRALYFNEDTYLGFIPGGKIEIVSIDPEIGGIFYILDIPKGNVARVDDGKLGRSLAPPSALVVERSRRCMNCHSGSETGYVPGINIKSVVPGSRGGSLDAFRVDRTGHDIPLSDRFGGWYLTGEHGLTNHWANAIGRMVNGEITKDVITPGERFSYGKYLVASSDILPQLVHEHQAGFVNRVLQAGYVARTYAHGGGKLTREQETELDRHARELVRYILFADEAALPEGGIKGDRGFISDFRRAGKASASLREFDLEESLFEFRCSYMIHSELFGALPELVKARILGELRARLTESDAEFGHLSGAEKRTIREILNETLPGFRL